VERWLDLPPGAWQRRRLYALRLKGQAFALLGFCPGDLVVVEPGAREQPGRIVVTRSSRGSSLRKIPHPGPIERRMPTVLELPLRERSLTHGEHVVGTVIGLLRATGTGALRPVPLSSSRTRPRRKGWSFPVEQRPIEAPVSRETISLDQLVEVRARWRQWMSATREDPSSHVTPAETERWERLEASLATLCDCLSRTHSHGLRAALAAEAGAVVATICSEMRG
jgi:hypothetical protein